MTALRLLLILLIFLSTTAFKPGIVGDMNVAGWVAPNWTNAAGVWSPSPGAGGELVTNGDLEAGQPTLGEIGRAHV